MAEGKPAKGKAAAEKRRREIKDAGQRTVLRGVEIDGWTIVRQIAKDRGLQVKNLEEAKRDKGLKAALDQLGLNEEGEVTVWVRVGQVEADSRDQAVTAVVGEDEPGQFRAPNASAWRGRVVRKVPERVQLDVEIADD
jgi:hypothetical protein